MFRALTLDSVSRMDARKQTRRELPGGDDLILLGQSWAQPGFCAMHSSEWLDYLLQSWRLPPHYRQITGPEQIAGDLQGVPAIGHTRLQRLVVERDQVEVL